MRTLVTTDSVPPAERFDLWAAETAKIFYDLDTRPGSAATFHGEAAGETLGALQLNALTAGPVRVCRSEVHARRRHEDYYKVILQTEGEARVEQDGHRGHLRPGELVLCDTTRPYSLCYDTDFRTVLLLLPRALLPFRPDILRGLTAHSMPADAGIGAVTGSFLRSLRDQSGTCSEPTLGRLADSAVSLITTLLAERLDRTPPTTPHQAMLLRVRDHIERRLRDPGLSPDSIAAAHHISRRYLFKLFAAEELTVAGWIRMRRLERCARDLADVSARDQPVAMIAARWGLIDGRHFSRLFKAAYGETPSEYRRRAGYRA